MALDRKYCCTKVWWRDFLRANLLVLLTIVGVVVGFFIGFWVRTLQPSVDAIIWIGLPGEVYMRMLKMMILPLIICSVITGTASLDPKCNGKVSAVALTYIVVTNIIPCLVGAAMVFAIKPGVGVELSEASEAASTHLMETSDIFADLIRNLFPDNIVAACFQKAQTEYSSEERLEVRNRSGELVNETVIVKIKTVGVAYSTNVLGLVVCCLIFGVAISASGRDGVAFYNFVHSANELIMRILKWFVWVTPVGVASLIALPLLKTGHLGMAIRSLGMFSVTVVTSLALYQFLIVPVYFFLLTRENPFAFLCTLGRPWMVSFAAASSAIAIPETLNSLEGVSHVDRRISRFVVPFASSLNRDGSCAFITVSCVFIAQLNDMELEAAQIVLIWVLSTLISMATPSVPSAGVVAVLIVLTALNIPSQAIGLLFATEWIVDRLRSGSNMLSHAHCAKATFILCKKSLPPPTKEDGHNANGVVSMTDVTNTNDVTIDVDAPSQENANGTHATDNLLV